MKRALVVLWAAVAFCFAISLAATSAQAGLANIQAHPLKLNGQVLAQGENSRTGDAKLEKASFNEKDIGALCLGQERLDRDQFVIVTLNDACNDPNNNTIQVVQRDPFQVLASIGSINFDLSFAIATERRGSVTLAVPAIMALACGEGTVQIDAGAVATVTVDSETSCVQTVKAQNAAGVGSILGESIIVNKTRVDAKKPAASLVDDRQF